MEYNLNAQHALAQPLIVTAGAHYLDIDAYACMVAMAELLQLQGKKAVAYSRAPRNYSVCRSLIKEGQIAADLSEEFQEQALSYIIVDVSDPEFLKKSVPLDRVVTIYDHHIGAEAYWYDRIGNNSHIEFIGAAATLIYREWKNAGLQDRMTPETARLLLAAILDNTLNLTSSNTTEEDREAYFELRGYAGVGEGFGPAYFSEVQRSVEADLKNALFGDIKTVRDNPILPPRVAQLCLWNAQSVLARLEEIRIWFASERESWMINMIDLSENCCYFVCDDKRFHNKLESVFDVRFEAGVARTAKPYLRKQMIKKTVFWV